MARILTLGNVAIVVGVIVALFYNMPIGILIAIGGMFHNMGMMPIKGLR